ncbi:MAG: Pseudouridine synthase [uncultured bacterium (gcode 4)]|uniref:Pseudouridine synthase n=1 Tax=uncultured bacterium (gcode 4) TaxID=1234023 RepID=K2AVI7_9BACT|nr:MAG: Pseudouridine synthase [uncultured bacterium (gcode 4)]
MKIFKIEENDADQRLDKFLKKLLVNSSLSLIYKINRKNKVKVNWKRQDNEYKIQIWDEIKIFLNDDEFELLTAKKEVVNAGLHSLPLTNFLDKKDIIYEDGDLLIINKNPGTIVHPGDFKTNEISLIQQVHDYLWNKLNSLTFKPSLIHRIDKDTSGIIMIAKTKPALDSMLKQLQDNKIEKYYLAVCIGTLTEKTWTIKDKIFRIKDAKSENKIKIDNKLWDKAITHYKVIKENIHEKYSLLECKLETWRMHQIRIHLSHIGHPVVWDNTYWNKWENSFLKRNFGVSRQFLHSYKISFIHPTKRVKLTFEAKLKPDMERFLGEI